MGNRANRSRKLPPAERAALSARLNRDTSPAADASRLSLPDLPHTAPLVPLKMRNATGAPSTQKGREVIDDLDSESGIEQSEGRHRVEAMQVDLEEEEEEEEVLEVEKVDEIDIARAEHAKVSEELESVRSQIKNLQELETVLEQHQEEALQRLYECELAFDYGESVHGTPNVLRTPVAVAPALLSDYATKVFPWSEQIKATAQLTFNIASFRLNQEAIMSASMDMRDIIVVAPTGAGKSLTYQLPALLMPGVTICVTPLISLMQDQTYNLKNLNIEAEMINADTNKEDLKEIMRRMLIGLTLAKGKGKAKELAQQEKEIKLVYVTPERIEKSKTFVSIMQKLYDGGLLPRIIIDEAHCISSLGNDFRPAYQTLGRLKTLFPNTPIIALTATAPPNVIKDMIESLQMPPIINATEGHSTLLFTSPLYRKNLQYSVQTKPASAKAAIAKIGDYIASSHAGKCGIIYCLSRADTEALANGINEMSMGKIKCRAYHSYLPDSEKTKIHLLWRTGRIHVVVATNAFGLGIDAPNVRFVIHHTLSKSLESYYQESGRAGRDGAKSDCVIFYRSADAARLSTLIVADFHAGGKEKLYAMLEYAEDLEGCRKITFAKYFAGTHKSKNAFQVGDQADVPCDNCDNCRRDGATYNNLDISDQVYRALRILAGASKHGVRPTLTLPQACDLVRGLKGGKFGTTEAGGKKGEGVVDVVAEAGEKVTLPSEQAESMILSLVLNGYLKQQFHQTAYSTLAYLALTPAAVRFTRFSTQTEFQQSGPPVQMYISVPVAAPKTKLKRKASILVKPKAAKKKQVAKAVEVIVIDDDDDKDDEDEGEDEGEDEEEQYERDEVDSDGFYSDERHVIYASDDLEDRDEWGFPIEGEDEYYR